MKRSLKFLITTILWLIIITAIVLFLYSLNEAFHLWANPVDDINKQIAGINSLFITQIVAGLSVGMILLVILLFMIPLFVKNIDSKTYIRNIIMGLLSSLVFFISQSIYTYISKFSKFYMIISIAIVIVFTIVIIEFIALSVSSKKKENSLRTDILSGVASGLIFGITLNIVTVIIGIFKQNIGI